MENGGIIPSAPRGAPPNQPPPRRDVGRPNHRPTQPDPAAPPRPAELSSLTRSPARRANSYPPLSRSARWCVFACAGAAGNRRLGTGRHVQSAQLVRFPSPVENFFTPLPRSASAGHVFRIYAPILFHGSFSLCNLYTVRLSGIYRIGFIKFSPAPLPESSLLWFFFSEWAQIAQGVGYEGIRWT
jgi:hypothetical protein